MTLACMVGFMAGALRSVWPFWLYTYAETPFRAGRGPQLIPTEMILPPATELILPTLCAIAGALVSLRFPSSGYP